MSEKLLRTKLYIPPRRPGLIYRQHLIEQLNQGLRFGHNLTLISAPAGFGKTTLVSEWIYQNEAGRAPPHEESHIHPSRVAWLSLDESDNDPNRFLAYFIAALNRLDGVKIPIGEGALSMIQSPQPPPAEAILTPLINEIANIPDKIIFVFDDYHDIESSQVDHLLIFLLEHLPLQLHLVIVTREDPHLPLARLRARRQLTELRAADLRFTSSEIAEFLNQELALELSTEDIAALETRTEGWITGLQLAALALRGQISIQGKKDVGNFIKSFTGSNRYILDYLIEEVLEQQSEPVQSFLLQTAVLDRMTGPLCNALTGQEDGRATLQMLEDDNLFIIPLDNERNWYRYHHLFADLLRQRLHQTQPLQIPILHGRASKWYEQNGYEGHATEHALRAEDFERAANLISEQADALWQRGEHAKLRQWLPKLPESILFSKPQLCIYHAWYLYASGQHLLAEPPLRAAEQALNNNTDAASESGSQAQTSLTDLQIAHLKGRVAAIRAFADSYQGDVPGIIQHARQALEYIPEQDSVWRSLSAIVLGDAYGFKGDMTEAYEARLEALRFCQAAGETYNVLLASMKLAITLRAQGRLQQTVKICQQQIQFAHQNGLSHSSLVGLLLVIWAEVLAELNDLDEATHQAKKALELLPRAIDLTMLGWGYMCLLRISFSKGELDGAEEIIQKMENIDRVSDAPPWVMSQIAAWQIRLWLEQGKFEAASQWLSKYGLDNGAHSLPLAEIDYFSLFNYIMLARILMAQDQLHEAAELLQGLLKPAERGGRTTRVIEILILLALTSEAQGFTDEAISRLEAALVLAEPEGFIRIFVDEGQPMTHLLHEVLNRGIAPGYVRRLLAAFPMHELVNPDMTTVQIDQPEWVESLSEREVEVLQLIAEGLTNPEIASRLFLSLNTVKVHTRNIYSKLDAHNRTQAVARARDLQILPA